MLQVYRDIEGRNRDSSGVIKRKNSSGRKKQGSKTSRLDEPVVTTLNPKSFLGMRIAKVFDHKLYFGFITDTFSDTEAECGFYFHATYDDGDEEDLDKSELDECLEM